ncbi:copper resistance protein CopC [Streptomyces radiopugnans]|uniref:Copper transport protein n=1 Tax=Streptomyces radiopugnans TaxID=403935 RepID=A0A1H9CJ39_9ACTN|nr:copper resistance protein CopC [Streptomyces radiopugnans]SEQ00713.1 copper transport protein [Streptomyces radiopugnans]
MTTTAPGALPRPAARTGLPGLSGPLGVLGVLGVLGLLSALLLGGAAPAAAHATLTGSDPAPGAVVDRAPRQVTLTFSESVSLADDAIRVLAPDGGRVDTGEPRDLSAGGEIRHGTGLRDGLPDGTYTVVWQAVSADSHPISGAFTFSVGAPSQTSAAVPEEEPGGGPAGVLHDIARYAAYTGFVLLVGGAVFVLGCLPAAARVRAVQRLVVAGWVTLTAATVAVLLLRVPYTGAGGAGDMLDTGALRTVLETRTGTALVSRLLLLAVAALFVSLLFGAYARRGGGESASGDGSGNGGGGEQARRDRRDLVFGLSAGGAVVAVGLAATWAAAEHASTGVQTAVAVPADIVHLLAVAVWLGGLAALLTALRWGPAVGGEAVRRFSRIALGCVAVLAATGLYQSWRQVGGWAALTSTSYGRLLLVKIALVALLLGVARFSRRHTARLADAPGDTTGDTAGDTVADTAGEQGKTVPEPVAAPEPVTVPEPGPDVTPERAAQLARQRAAVEAARRRRERDADPVRAGLRRSVLAEAAVAAAVLAVTTLLTAAEPARTAAASGTASGTAAEQRQEQRGGSGSDRRGPLVLTVPFDTGGPDGAGRAQLLLDPGGSGGNSLLVRTTTPGGEPLDAPEVRVAFTLPARDLGPLTVPLKRTGEGRWSATGLQLPLPGAWEAAVTVRTSDIDQVTERKTFELD